MTRVPLEQHMHVYLETLFLFSVDTRTYTGFLSSVLRLPFLVKHIFIFDSQFYIMRVPTLALPLVLDFIR
jgi:hypothetical protein